MPFKYKFVRFTPNLSSTVPLFLAVIAVTGCSNPVRIKPENYKGAPSSLQAGIANPTSTNSPNPSTSSLPVVQDSSVSINSQGQLVDVSIHHIEFDPYSSASAHQQVFQISSDGTLTVESTANGAIVKLGTIEQASTDSFTHILDLNTSLSFASSEAMDANSCQAAVGTQYQGTVSTSLAVSQGSQLSVVLQAESLALFNSLTDCKAGTAHEISEL
jgi:hypothetical protein